MHDSIDIKVIIIILAVTVRPGNIVCFYNYCLKGNIHRNKFTKCNVLGSMKIFYIPKQYLLGHSLRSEGNTIGPVSMDLLCSLLCNDMKVCSLLKGMQLNCSSHPADVRLRYLFV